MTDPRRFIEMQVGPGIFRLGTGLTAFHLLEEGGRYTLVDGAFPRYFQQLTRFLSERGGGLEMIDAQVLTHHHPDHRGMTERIRRETAGPVWIHHVDQPHLSRPAPTPRAPIWRPYVFKAIAHMVRNGVTRTPPVLESSAFDDGEVLDVPGGRESWQSRATPGVTVFSS